MRTVWTMGVAQFLGIVSAVGSATAAVTVDGQKLTVLSGTVEAVFDGAVLSSLRPAGQTTEFIHPQPSPLGLDTVFLNGQTLGNDKHQQVTVRKVSEWAARIDIAGEESHRTLIIAVDEDTGDILVTPDSLTDRGGVRAVRWFFAVDPAVTMTLPVINGMHFRADAHFPFEGRFRWPFEWNAQMALLHRDAWTVMIHTEDTRLHYKALQLIRKPDRTELGFETEPPGPLWPQRTIGGVTWRISACQADWRTPAGRYRQWMEKTYDLAAKRRHRPPWVDRITLAVCWLGATPVSLDALAAVHPPDQTLIHLSGWRTDPYDHNYPEYKPTEEALAFMAKARQMGFHVMPHFNFFAVWEKHPLVCQIGDFRQRNLDTNAPEGWFWPPDTHDYTRMIYMHPALGYWRNLLTEVVLEACRLMGTDVAFLDQTLCLYNIDNAVLSGLTPPGGLLALQEQFAAVEPGLVLAGEGLNEISFQRQAFAQAHIYNGWGQLNPDNLAIAHPICAFLWEGHTRLIGYYHLTPGGATFDLGVEVYERMGALPTIITGDPAHLSDMAPGTRRIFERARALSAALPAATTTAPASPYPPGP